jgi:hypothetical protein
VLLLLCRHKWVLHFPGSGARRSEIMWVGRICGGVGNAGESIYICDGSYTINSLAGLPDLRWAFMHAMETSEILSL